jgi:ABC-type lipoprotein release transport system permease subunit
MDGVRVRGDAFRLLVRSHARRRWRAQLVLAALVAVAVAGVAVPLAGARRSASAVDRFAAYANAPDVEVSSYAMSDRVAKQIRALPQVEDSANYSIFLSRGRSAYDFVLVACADGAFDRIARPRLLTGRRPHADSIDEIAINESAAKDLHLHVGDTVDLATTKLQSFLEQKEVTDGPRLHLHVVGVVRLLDQLQATGTYGGAMASPAFYRTYSDQIARLAPNIQVRLRPGSAVPAYERAVRRVVADGDVTFDDWSVKLDATRQSINVQVAALSVIAAVLALVAMLVVGQALAREIDDSRDEERVWWALGIGPRHRALLLTLGRAPALVIGAVGAVVLAIAASPFLPVGLARRADIDPGVHADWPVLLSLSAVAAVGGLAATFWFARSTSRAKVSRRSSAGIDTALAALPPRYGIGIRYALVPQRGSGRVPARSVVAGVALASVGIVGAATFAATLTRFGDSPDRWGWTWDRRADATEDVASVKAAVSKNVDVAAAANLEEGQVLASEHQLPAFAMQSLKGEPAFGLRTGRLPLRADEVALGENALDTLGIGVDDSVSFAVGKRTRAFHVVGEALIPPIDASAGWGAIFTPAGFRAVHASTEGSTTTLLWYRPGRQDAAERTLRAESGGPLQFSGWSAPQPPEDADRYLSIDAVPVALALFFGLLGTTALVHVVVVTGRRRLGDFAILRGLGMKRRQVATVLSAQATTIVTIGAVVGLPFGVLASQAVWRGVASRLGVGSDVAVPALWLGALAVAAFTTCFAVAWVASSRPRRLRPAVLLRSE